MGDTENPTSAESTDFAGAVEKDAVCIASFRQGLIEGFSMLSAHRRKWFARHFEGDFQLPARQLTPQAHERDHSAPGDPPVAFDPPEQLAP